MKALLITFSQTVRVICDGNEPTDQELEKAFIKASEHMMDANIESLDETKVDEECPFGFMMSDLDGLTKEQLGKHYEIAVGYDPFEDDPSIPVETVKKMIVEYADEMLNKWECTDASCNQYRKTIKEDEIYIFKEDRIVNPNTGETEVFTKRMSYADYDWFEIVDACKSFGYTENEIDKWITSGEEIPLILECLFELSN